MNTFRSFVILGQLKVLVRVGPKMNLHQMMLLAHLKMHQMMVHQHMMNLHQMMDNLHPKLNLHQMMDCDKAI